MDNWNIYKKSFPEFLGLSKENPKVKTARSIQILFLILIIGRELSSVLGLDGIIFK